MAARLLPGMLLAALLLAGGMAIQAGINHLQAHHGSREQTCAVGVVGTTYVLRISGPTADTQCNGFLAASRKDNIFPEYSADPRLATVGRIIVCQGVETDGNLHQIYDASKNDFYAVVACGRLRQEVAKARRFKRHQ